MKLCWSVPLEENMYILQSLVSLDPDKNKNKNAIHFQKKKNQMFFLYCTCLDSMPNFWIASEKNWYDVEARLLFDNTKEKRIMQQK